MSIAGSTLTECTRKLKPVKSVALSGWPVSCFRKLSTYVLILIIATYSN